MRSTCLVGLALFAILIIGCDQATMMNRITPPEEESVARGYVELLRQQNLEKIKHELDPSLVDDDVQAKLSAMAAFFPAESPKSVKIVGANVSQGQQMSRACIAFEYQFTSKWLWVSVTTERKDGIRSVVGLCVTPIADSLENLNRFTLTGKSAIQYLTLMGAVGCTLFTFYVFALCARSRDFRAKWLWMIIVLVGVGKFAVNWGTGEWTFQLVAVQIPCFEMARYLYQPWRVAGFVPVGALFFLLQHRWSAKIKGDSVPASTNSSINAFHEKAG